MNPTEFSDVVVAAKLRAEAKRAEWLESLSLGFVSVSDVITAACSEDGKPLLSLTLRKLLAAQPGWGEARAMRTVLRVCRILGAVPEQPRKLTVAWLIDARTAGHRIEVWADVINGKPGQPWAGFPYAPEPERGI